MKYAKRLGVAAALCVGTVVALAVPAWSLHAGEFCSNADAAAGTVTAAENGGSIQCQPDGTGHNRWVEVVSPTPTTAAPTSPVAASGPLIREPGEFCNPAQVAVTPNGDSLSCSNLDAAGHYHWLLASGELSGTHIVSSNATTATTLRAANVAAVRTNRSAVRSSATLAKTGLHNTDKLIEIAVLLLALGVALVSEVRARNGLDRLRRE